MTLDSYEKASLDILSCLRKDPTIFIVNGIVFRTTAAASKSAKMSTYDCGSFQYVSMLEIIPDIYHEIELALPYPSKDDLKTTDHFITELVASCGITWVPISCHDYQRVLHTKFQDDLSMALWQRYIRAEQSNDPTELTILSIDPIPSIREKASSRLKTMK